MFWWGSWEGYVREREAITASGGTTVTYLLTIGLNFENGSGNIIDLAAAWSKVRRGE